MHQVTESFRTRVPGKWVLAGEHSVLRGGVAVALPHLDSGLTLSFQSSREKGLRIYPPEAKPILRTLLESCDLSPQDENLKGTLRIESGIPVGAGLGSSAALCVALTQWIASLRSIPEPKQPELATSLENHFHGKSSGLDVAVISVQKPVSFTMKEGARPLEITQLPRFTLHDTGLRAGTRECILKVENLRERDPGLFEKTDQAMNDAASAAIDGLARNDLGRVASAMRQAQECFEEWGLMPEKARALQKSLLHEGALAVKLTGGGDGGFLIALWPS